MKTAFYMCALFVTGVALSFATRRYLLRRLASVSSEEAHRLADLWKGGVETMLRVPPMFENLVLAPCETDAASVESFEGDSLPFAKAFALTAFDPPGVSRTREANAEANGALWHDIVALSPSAVWRGFGCDLKEGWREDGFIVRFDADLDAAKRLVLALAAKYDQGAIYEYYATREGGLRRRTIGAKLADIDEETPMRRLSPDALQGEAIARLPWAGPKGAGIL